MMGSIYRCDMQVSNNCVGTIHCLTQEDYQQKQKGWVQVRVTEMAGSDHHEGLVCGPCARRLGLHSVPRINLR